MRRTLSSKLTFALKVLIPFCLIAAWLLSMYNLYANYWGRNSVLRFGAPLIIAVFVFESWGFVRLKKVSVDDCFLYASNYLQEIRIPFENIDQVVEQRWNGATYPVELSLKEDSEFGRSIRFMPKARFGHSIQDSGSVIDKLRSMASGA